MITPAPSIYRSWSDEDLLEAAGADRQEYREEAVVLIDEELRRRGIRGEKRADLEQKVKSEKADDIQRLTGVRGWLLLFTLVVATSSVRLVIEGLNQVAGSEGSVLGALPSLVIGGYGCFVAAQLLQRGQSAPRHATRWLLVSLFANFGYAGLVYLTSGEIALLPFYGLGALVWLEYLRKSRRVRATYANTSATVEPSPAPDGSAGGEAR